MRGNGRKQIPHLLHATLQPHSQTLEHRMETERQHGQQSTERILQRGINVAVRVSLLIDRRLRHIQQLLIRIANITNRAVVQLALQGYARDRLLLLIMVSILLVLVVVAERQRAVQRVVV